MGVRDLLGRIVLSVFVIGCFAVAAVATSSRSAADPVPRMGERRPAPPPGARRAPGVRGAAGDPSPPAEPVKLIFIHHSCGENWLNDGDGGLGIALRDDNYFVSDTNYGWGPDAIGDLTDIGHWWNWFRGPSSSTYLGALYTEYGKHSGYSRMATDPGGENDVIMFKSCYPNSYLGGNPSDPPTTGANPLRGHDAYDDSVHTVANAKGIYNDILATFGNHQDKLFVVITAPPQMASETDAAHAANARAFNDWLVEDWLSGYAHDNVAVFDFYNVLTSNGGDRHTNDAREATGNHHRWRDGAVQHVHPVDRDTSAYWGGSGGGSHPTAAGNRKATAEFIDLLNVFYNRWRADDGTPTATATATATGTSTPAASPSTSTPTPTGTPTAPPGGQQTLIFQDGVSPHGSYAGTTDVILANDDNVASNANLGGTDNLETFFGDGEEHRRSLMRWDISALPGDVTVTSAAVELYRYGGSAENAMQVALHCLTRDWAEGTGWDLQPDPSYVPDGATWTLAKPGTAWTSPGGDHDVAIVGGMTLPVGMGNGWVSLDATTAVRAWVERSVPNYGLLLRPQSGDYTYHYYYSRNHTVASLRPRLVVTYTAGSAPTATPTATATPWGPPSAWVYLPIILKGWSTPLPAATATPTPTATTSAPSSLVQPADLVYQGAFAYPSGEAWAYSGHALAYYPAGDSGSSDSYMGSLYAAGHDQNDLVGEISIPEPVISDDFESLPKASVLRAMADVTGAWKDNCTYVEGCIYREVDGLAYLSNVDKIVWNLRDWYNTARYDQDSLGWSNLDLTGAQGVWHIGGRPADDDVFHNAKTCDYLFLASESFAEEYLDGKWLIAGNHREAGALGGSQGPTLYALAPWEDGNPPVSGQNLDALALLYYREIYECVWEGEEDIEEDPDPGVCDFPGYRAADEWRGGVWVEAGDRSGVLIVGRKALGDNCYDTQAACGGDPCDMCGGYHAYPYEPQILFYDPDELRSVVAGTQEPWKVLPYAVYSPVGEVFDPECAVLGAAAYDRERNSIYVTEREAGPWGETAVHVWRVE